MWFLLAQEHGGAGAPEISPLDLPHHANVAAAVWAWVIFALLMILLWKFAWGPIAKGLEARAHRISESLAKAEAIEKATRELAETNKALLAKTQQEAQQIVADARTAGRHAAEEVMKKAAADIDAQRERFTRETQLLIDKAREDLRRETVGLTVAATSLLLGRSMTDADGRRLAEQALHDAESVTRN